MARAAFWAWCLVLLSACGPRPNPVPQLNDGVGSESTNDKAKRIDRARDAFRSGRLDEALTLFEGLQTEGVLKGQDLLAYAQTLAMQGDCARAMAILGELQASSDGARMLPATARDESFVGCRQEPEFRNLSGYFSVAIVNSAGAEGLAALSPIVQALNARGFPDVKLSDTSAPRRLKPLVEFKPEYSDRLQEIELVLGAKSIDVAELPATATDDIVITWGHPESLPFRDGEGPVQAEQVSTDDDPYRQRQPPEIGDPLSLEPDAPVVEPLRELDAASLATLESFEGRLLLRAPSDGDQLSLPLLRELRGDLVITDEALRWVELPALERIDGNLEIRDLDALTAIDLSALRRVEGNLELSRTSKLSRVRFDRLESVAGIIDVADNEGLELLEFPRLEIVDRLSLVRNPVLATLEIGALQHVAGNLTLASNPKLAQLALPALAETGGALVLAESDAITKLSVAQLASVGGLQIEDNPRLESCQLAALTEVHGDLSLMGNRKLADVDLSALTLVQGELVVVDNASLTKVDIRKLNTIQGGLSVALNDDLERFVAETLERVGGQLTISDNQSLADVGLTKLQNVDGSLAISNNALPPLLLETIRKRLDQR